MYNIIYIADNETDLAGIPVEEYVPVSEIRQEDSEDETNSEMSFLAGKLLISFTALIICIAIFLVLVFLFKRKFSAEKNNPEYDGNDVFEPKEENLQSDAALLNTPRSINKCIRTFLENTRDL